MAMGNGAGSWGTGAGGGGGGGGDGVSQADFDAEKALRTAVDQTQDAFILGVNNDVYTRVLRTGDTSTGAQLTTRTPTQILANDNEFITKAALEQELFGINNVDGSYLGAQVNGAFNVGEDAKEYWTGACVQSNYDYVISKPHLVGAPAAMELRGYAILRGKQTVPYQGKKNTVVSYDYQTDWAVGGASKSYVFLNYTDMDNNDIRITNTASSQVRNNGKAPGMHNQAEIVSYNVSTGELVVDNGTAFLDLDKPTMALYNKRLLNFPTSYQNSKGGTYTWYTRNVVNPGLPATAQVDNLDGTFSVFVEPASRALVGTYAAAGGMVYLGTSGGAFKYLTIPPVSNGVWANVATPTVSGFDAGGEWVTTKAPEGTAGTVLGMIPNHNSSAGDINNRMWLTNIAIDIT